MLNQLTPQSLKNLYHLVRAMLAALYYRFPAKDLTVIGVTGTDGKTTTSFMLYHLIQASGHKVALISTVGAYIGSKQINTGFHVTSPNPWALQRLIRHIVDQGFNYLVLEATSHGLDQHRLFATNVNVAILTNISHEHLDYHHDLAHYTRAKAKLFQQARFAVLNRDDSSFSALKTLIPSSTKIVPYSKSDVSANQYRSLPHFLRQPYNRFNLAAVLAACRLLDIHHQDLSKALGRLPQIPGRMESITNSRRLRLIVDFAHTPNALENALTSLKKSTRGKLIAVYGSAGLRDRSKRPLMGQVGSVLADELILTAEDPRTEPVWTILDQMTSNVTINRGHIHKIPDRARAINFAVSLAKPGDTVAVFGKGHEQSMCYGWQETPWSDKKAVIDALKT